MLKPSDRSYKDLEKFLTLTCKNRLAPTKEQICLIIDTKLSNEEYKATLTIPQRISILHSIARLENTVCKVVTKEPYFDELHDFYQMEIDHFIPSVLEKVKSLATLFHVAKAVKDSKYRP